MLNIIIKGARVHNLKNIDIEIPRNKISVFVGVSGSGKSTIAYDIVAMEGQRQFLESISTFAARLLKKSGRPDMDSIQNISPTISIDQSRLRGNPRSTVGTSTEIYTYLRLLFSRFGTERNLSAGDFSFNNPKGACMQCKGLGTEYDIDPRMIFDFEKSLNEGACSIDIFKPGSRYFNIMNISRKLDMDKPIRDYSQEELDFLLYSPKIKLEDTGQGFVQSFSHEGVIRRLIGRATDLRGMSDNKEKNEKKYWIQKSCTQCFGSRLNAKALRSTIQKKNIGQYATLGIAQFMEEMRLLAIEGSEELIRRILVSAQNLVDVDLGYLSLNRSLDTLSGGESQRLKLARELGSDLIEMIYILDEPTAGLHSRDKEKIMRILEQLCASGNTVIAVEHDDSVMQRADKIIEIGPGAGVQGGTVVFEGSFSEMMGSPVSITGKCMVRKTGIKQSVRAAKEYITIQDATSHNLKNVTVKVPLGVFCSVTGVSGSGKSSLILDELVHQHSDREMTLIDQAPIFGTARGNMATYTGIFDVIRSVFAKENGVAKNIFSSNSVGACPDCDGLGFHRVDMHFMGDVKIVCETCQGKKYQETILQYRYLEKNIHDVLSMTVSEAYAFFEQMEIRNGLQMLVDVGLGYVTLGQTHDTLSGGEAQRLKLASKLNKEGKIFILDEPTSGLHFSDIEFLLKLLNRLVDRGNSVIVIEHNLTVIRQSDWIIDLGPEGGDNGGRIVAEGTPGDIAKNQQSVTGKYL